jgi:hypothetical protein
MDFARQEARAEVSPSRTSPPQLPPSPKIRPRARRQSQAEEERGEGGVRREPGDRGENGRRSPGSQLGQRYQTRANGPSGPGRPFLARIKQTPTFPWRSTNPCTCIGFSLPCGAPSTSKQTRRRNALCANHMRLCTRSIVDGHLCSTFSFLFFF